MTMTADWRWVLRYRSWIGAVVVLLVLLLLAGMRFSLLEEKTREGTTIGRLYELRQALLLYYQDHNGMFPRELNAQSPFGRYQDRIPAVDGLHPSGGQPSPAGNEVTYGTTGPSGYGRGWYYNYETGQIFVNSIGLDSRGVSYTTY